jgi:hypothetical protein
MQVVLACAVRILGTARQATCCAQLCAHVNPQQAEPYETIACRPIDADGEPEAAAGDEEELVDEDESHDDEESEDADAGQCGNMGGEQCTAPDDDASEGADEAEGTPE